LQNPSEASSCKPKTVFHHWKKSCRVPPINNPLRVKPWVRDYGHGIQPPYEDVPHSWPVVLGRKWTLHTPESFNLTLPLSTIAALCVIAAISLFVAAMVMYLFLFLFFKAKRPLSFFDLASLAQGGNRLAGLVRRAWLLAIAFAVLAGVPCFTAHSQERPDPCYLPAGRSALDPKPPATMTGFGHKLLLALIHDCWN
jgi:hypothetical protein